MSIVQTIAITLPPDPYAIQQLQVLQTTFYISSLFYILFKQLIHKTIVKVYKRARRKILCTKKFDRKFV